jgi:hypothetical protein
VHDDTAFARSRLLVVAFEGWNDAGEAASGAVRMLKDQLDVSTIACFDPEDFFDYQFTRPTIAAAEDGTRQIEWPEITIYGPTTPNTPPGASLAADAELQVSADNGSNIYLMVGTEPSRKWKRFTHEVMEAIVSNNISSIVFLGAMLADVPHSRPISIFTSSENTSVRAQLGIERSTYQGPVGILSVVADAAERQGIATIAIWASVPHYVHNAPSPKATLALVDKLEEIIDVVIPRGNLVDEAAAWEGGINAVAAEDDDMASYIEQLEQARDTVDSPEASGEAIAQQFERYLSRDDKPDGQAGEEPWRPAS